MSTFSFWIIPENDFYQELESVIAKYSKEYGYPIFPPHLSLHPALTADEVTLVGQVKEAARKILPFEMQVGPVECSTTYHQSVFVRLRTSAELLTAHMTLKQALGVTEKFVFMPHISLVYGDFDMHLRDSIAQKITLTGTSFQATAITLVREDSPEPNDWNIVERISLG